MRRWSAERIAAALGGRRSGGVAEGGGPGPDRAAIDSRQAEPGDTVVIAGKGHEQGQEFEEGRKLPFDDREVAREELRRL